MINYNVFLGINILENFQTCTTMAPEKSLLEFLSFIIYFKM